MESPMHYVCVVFVFSECVGFIKHSTPLASATNAATRFQWSVYMPFMYLGTT